MIIVSSGTGTVTNINTTAPLSGGPITTSGTITTTMATNKLIGRSTAGTGVMEEITVGTGLSLSGGTLSNTGGATAAGSTNEIQFNNAAAFAASGNLRWIIADNRLLLGSENTADTNSRMVIIGKGISTQNTFVVHNQTGTNNSLVVRDDGRVGIGVSAPNGLLQISGTGELLRLSNGTTGIFVNTSSGLVIRTISNHFVRIQDYLGNQVLAYDASGITLNKNLSYIDGINIIIGTTNGTKIGTATTQKIGFWNATPIVQPDTTIASATFVQNSGTRVDEVSTFDGYTIAQVVRALRNQGLLA